LYPWHPWFGRLVWVHQTRVNQGQLITRCGLDQKHEARGIEIAQWMFDTAVCCHMHMAEEPVASVEALRELRILLALRSGPNPEGVLQGQHHPLSLEGGANASLTDPAMGAATGARDPQWEQLPWEVRQQTVRLLARMLRAHCDRALVSQETKEASDE